MSHAEEFRKYAITALTNEICNLSGAGFESWCYLFIPTLAASVSSWSHRGTTSLGAPVGYTVDSSGDHATVVAQYSSQQDYFGSSKPVDDLNSTLKKHPQVKQIWLLAAVSATPNERTKSDNAIAEWKRTHPEISVQDRDARQIAGEIVDRLDSDKLVLELGERLPSLFQIANESAFSHAVPKTDGYVPRPEQEQQIRNVLTNKRYAVVGGISGVGKTALAACVARGFDAETLVWLDATDVADPGELRAVSVERRKQTHNLLALLQNRQTLLVLDNLKTIWSSETYQSLAGSKSFVLTTTQFAGNQEDVIQVSSPNAHEARQLVDSAAGSACPEKVFAQIFAATGGHTLVLRVLAGLVREKDTTWDAVLEFLPTVVSHGEDERAVKICERILQNHLPSIGDELKAFVWAGTSYLDAELLTKAVSSFAALNLRKRHFLAISSSRTIRLHDIIYSAAQAVLEVEQQRSLRYRSGLVGLLTADDSNDTTRVHRIGRAHPDLIVRELSRESDWGLMHAAARARLRMTAVEAFGDLPEHAKTAFASGGSAAVRAVIEAVEACYSLTSGEQGHDAAKEKLSSLMCVFDTLSSTSSLPADIARDIRHHRAKMLIRVDRRDEAEVSFRELLLEDPHFDAAKLQLARLVGTRAPEEAALLCNEIISNTGAGATLRIAAWLELAQLKPSSVTARVGEIIEHLKSVDVNEIAAAYGLAAQVASKLSFNEPETAIALFRVIEEGEPSFSSDRERCDWARAQLAAAEASRESDSFTPLLCGAIETYSAVLPDHLGNFHRVQYAKALILREDYERAGAILDGMDDAARSAFWFHRRAQVARGMQDLELALTYINEALGLLDGNKFRSALLEERFNIRQAKSDGEASADLKAAIEVADNDKYRAKLSQILGRLEAEDRA